MSAVWLLSDLPFLVANTQVDVIQVSKPEPQSFMPYVLTDFEGAAIRPFLPNKQRGVPRVNDRRVLNGIFWILRSGAPWRDLPESFGPYTTCYNRFVRWRMAGIWDLIMEALPETHDGSVQMIDTSIVRVHQHGGCAGGGETRLMGRSRGGLTTKTHACVDPDGSEIAKTQSVLAHVCIGHAIWWSASSIRSSNAGASPPDVTNWRQITLPSSSSQPFGFGSALMSPRPNGSTA